MKINSDTWDKVDIHEIAAVTYAARKAVVMRESLTVEKIEERFRNFLSENPTKIITAYSGAELIGVLILYINNATTLEMNPGQILGGNPVVAPGYDAKRVGESLIEEAIALAGKGGFKKIEFVTSMEDGENIYQSLYEAHNFTIKERYVEMICHLTEPLQKNTAHPECCEMKPLNQVSKDDLYQCYYHSFITGDAQFFFTQDDQERREYFDMLGYEDAVSEPASMVLMKDQQLIGFSLVLPYGEENCHISCMCIESEFRRRGLGERLLHILMNEASQQGYKTITLGTDTSMGAYYLYKKNGFEITNGSISWLWHS